MLHDLRMIQILAVFATLLLSGMVEAGDWGRNKHLRREVPYQERFFNHRVAPDLSEDKMPTAFDWGDVDGVNYLNPSWNQHIPHYCGSCYLHGSLSMIQDRISVRTKGKSRVMLGRQTFLNCAPLKNLSQGCNGGDVIDVVRYMAQYGLPDESCMPYKALDYTALEEPPAGSGLTKEEHHCPMETKCMNCMPDETGDEKCWQVSTPVTYRLWSYGQVQDDGPSNRVARMMSEIMHNGPITCGITTADSFVYGYNGTIWADLVDDDVDHDVEVVGWGEENGVKFWNIRNSWGTYWGTLGFFRLQRGVNANHIEDGDCWYADPNIEMEKDVQNGDLVGSMDGLQPKPHARQKAQLKMQSA